MSTITGKNGYYFQTVNFRAQQDSAAKNFISKPIEKVENIVNNTVDTFIPEQKDEEKKKSHKNAIRAGSIVLVLGALVALLNPRFSAKWLDKMKEAAAKAGVKAKNNKGITGKLYKGVSTFLEKSAKVLSFANNYNSIKDSYFKKWCTQKTTSKNTVIKKLDSCFVGIMKKPHEYITNVFDNISKNTVYKKYAKARSGINVLDATINNYKNKISPQEQLKLQDLLIKAKKLNEYLSEPSVKSRLQEQERLMSNLEVDTMNKINSYFKTLWKGPNRIKHVKKNLNFWAQDILMPSRNKLAENSQNVLNTIFGKNAENKGVYEEIYELLSPKLNQEEKGILREFMSQAEEKLTKANHSECIEYFDKKRDLKLGGAPTDVVTGLIGLGAAGYAIGTADTKEDRQSRFLTVAFPAVAGFGVTTAMTAMLFSGVKGMLCGLGSGVILSRIGSKLDKTFINNENRSKEVKCSA